MKPIFKLLLVALMLIASPLFAAAAEHSEDQSESSLNPKETIFEHLGDAYGWEVPFNHHVRIPLPVIVKGTDGLHVFSSARVANGATYTDGDATFAIAGKQSPNKGKVVQLVDGKEVKPSFDISITKNVAALFISIALVIGIMLWLASYHRRHPYKAPRKGLGFIELIVVFIYDSVVKSTLGDKAKKFAPYLMTVFFFIFFMNLLGLVVVFPGGANLTGNIAVTMSLAIMTFLMTNLFGTKHYWKDIFWPDVPLWLKFPLPIMPMIEIFGMFTKPAALTVRLFANMMGGHMIVIVLTLLIFIFSAVNPVAGGATTVVSVAFSVFMLLIDVLVSFIQAYVFTMLSTIFISLAQEHPHEEHPAVEA
jgi:F-type H+-transporting ATPase subunit a